MYSMYNNIYILIKLRCKFKNVSNSLCNYFKQNILFFKSEIILNKLHEARQVILLLLKKSVNNDR